jgi:hypothetical protein
MAKFIHPEGRSVRKKKKLKDDGGFSDHYKLFWSVGYELERRASQKIGDDDWLPIDDFIEKLRRRNRPPKLRPKDDGSRESLVLWEVLGPHNLIRAHLGIALQQAAFRDPERRQRSIDDAKSFIGNALELKEAILEFAEEENPHGFRFSTFCDGQPPEEKSRRYRISIDLEKSLLGAVNYLTEMEKWAWENYNSLSPPEGGKPKIEWRHEFVSFMAHTWWVFTGKQAPVGPNTLFMEFVEIAWASGGDQLPEISWEATVRSVLSKAKYDETGST